MATVAACASPGEVQNAAPQFDVEAAARGRALAENVCSACHAVAPQQLQSPRPDAPAFQSIANTPGMTTVALNAWMHTPHPTMPNLIITSGQTEDIAAYLASLDAH